MFKLRKTISIFTILLILIFANFGYAEEHSNIKDYDTEYKSLVQILHLIQTKYVNKIEISELVNSINEEEIFKSNTKDPAKLARIISETIIKKLNDPHTLLLPPEFKEERESREKTYGGIGILIYPVDNEQLGKGILISDVFQNGPAEKAGLYSGYLIIEINKIPVSNFSSLGEIKKNITGEPGTEVELTVINPDEKTPKTVRITREITSYNPIKYRILKSNIGYVKILEFDAFNLAERLKKVLDELTQNGAKGFIIDLRNNLGGLLFSTIRTLELFIGNENQELLIFTLKNKDSTVPYYIIQEALHKEHIVVLVNEKSASASEIFAGVMKHYKRAVIIGTKTFGKGSTQGEFMLENGHIFLITTNKYYLPNDVTPDKIGIYPDIIIENDDKKPGDEQLEKAIEVINGLLNETSDIFMEKNGQKLDDEPPEKTIEFINGILIDLK